MSYTLENFYKSTITKIWSAGTGDFNVAIAPTETSGILVISPNNATLREIIEYSSVGTNTYGAYVTVITRGMGGTTAQTHAINEPIRMNITAEHWASMQDDIDSIVAAGASNASTTTKGLVEEATTAEILAGSTTGSTGAKLFTPIDKSCQTFVKTVSLTSSQIKTMYTTPVQLIAAPGAGMITVPEEITFYNIYGTATYTGGGTVRLQYTGDTTQMLGTTNIDSAIKLASTNVAKGNFAPISTSRLDITVGINAAIEITNASAVFATGDGTLKVFIKYRVITL